jgi:outer membrane protein
MKKLFRPFVLAALLCGLSSAHAADAAKPVKIGYVNFKQCVEESKIGKQEEASFETMKKQMENIVEEKEKALSEMAAKLNDPDQLDLMSPEAETELKRKFRAQSQELNQLQAQYYQTLNQANFKVVQKLSEIVSQAASKVAKSQNLDIVLNNETCFYTTDALDISSLIVKEMDLSFAEEAKQTPTAKLE